MNCSICHEVIKGNYGPLIGHNAEPVNGGRCCDTCNANVVMPARVNRLMSGKTGNLVRLVDVVQSMIEEEGNDDQGNQRSGR